MTSALIYDPRYLKHETGRHHPEHADRLNAITASLEADAELWDSLRKVAPTPASDEDILRCHGAKLIDQIRNLCERGIPLVDIDTRICVESFEVARLAAGAVVTAVDQVFTGDAHSAFALVRPPGHHATPTQAMGFCLFNNAAVGARHAQVKHGAERVLIVDWDVHHGNGTQDIFYSDPSVFYLSTHQSPHYPGTGAPDETGEGSGEGTTINIPLRAGTPARTHREAFREALKVIEKKFPPDLVIISAGFDSHIGDPLGGLLLKDADFREMTFEVMDLVDRRASGRVVSVLEGGYNLETLGETVKRHVVALAGRDDSGAVTG
ncbi:MAG TPA: histone deacetylase [Blastocatellia bacterium]|nr:histone deacetylase [Blastocatellia bacterium]